MGLDELQGSASLEVLDLVFKKRSEGNNVISFYIGESQMTLASLSEG